MSWPPLPPPPGVRVARGDELLSKAQFEDREIARARELFLTDDRPIDVALSEFEARVEQVMRGESMPYGYLQACAREAIDDE